MEIERCLGSAQDIEWAFDGETFKILQSRPISGGSISRQVIPDRIWTRANIGEVLPGPVTPLTWDVFRATLLNRPSLLRNANETEEEGIRKIYGRVYLRRDSLFNSFCYLPKVTPQVLGEVLGADLPDGGLQFVPPSGLLVRMAQLAFVMDALRFLPYLSWVNRPVQWPVLSQPKRIEQLIDWTSRCFRTHLRCTAYAIGAFALLSWLLDRWIPQKTGELLREILTGRENFQTAAQGNSLWKLAEEVQGNKALRKALSSHTNWSELAKNLQDVEGGPAFIQKMVNFLIKNGSRSSEEFELAVPRWREDPSFVLSVLQKYLRSLGKGTQHGGDDRRRRQQEAVDRIKSSLSPLKRWVFTRLLSSYSRYSTLRENMKYRLIEGFAQLRERFLEIGNDLVKRGGLAARDDIFFLRAHEIFEDVTHTDCLVRKQDLIQTRRKQHALWSSQVIPDTVDGEIQAKTKKTTAQLEGIGTSSGSAEGFARVLFAPSEAASLEPGEILVAPYTDPGWTPLFLTCKAIVTEIGGFLSHGATVAREYGIPAVLSVKEVTQRIRTGDFIRVDGTNGLVTVLEQAKTNATD